MVLDPRSLRASAFWSLLFLDCIYQFTRFGGFAVTDFAVHGCFLIAAILCLGLPPKLHRVPRLFLTLAGVVLTLALLQLAPLPEWLFPWLAPLKAQAIAKTSTLIEFEPNRQLTMVPSYHSLLLAKLALDFVFAYLVLSGPRPRRTVFRFWFRAIALLLSLLMISAARGILPADGMLGGFNQTYGGLVNTNHFAVTTVILILICLQSLVYGVSRWVRELRNAAGHKSSVLVAAIQPIVDLVILDLSFVAFRLAHSRSGAVLLVIGVTVFFGQIALLTRRQTMGIAMKVGFATALGSLLLLTFLPLGHNADKFRHKGFSSGPRIDAMKVAAQQIQSFPVLGAGLGSTYSILPSEMPSEPNTTEKWTEYHNDYLQVAVEFGLPGVLAVCMLLSLLWRGLDWRIDTKIEYRFFVIAARSTVIVLMLHSLVSFPLRVPAVRCLAILFVGAAMRQIGKKALAVSAPPTFWVVSSILIGATSYLGYQAGRTPPVPLATPSFQYAWTYGRHFELDMLEANQAMQRVLGQQLSGREMLDALDEAQALIRDYLNKNPKNIFALNTDFMARTIRTYLNDPNHYPDDLEARASKIEAFAHPDNANGKLPQLFLFSVFEESLNEAQKQDYEALRLRFRSRLLSTEKTSGL